MTGKIKFEDLSDVLSPKDVQVFLETSPNKVYQLLFSGEIPSRKIGSRWIIPKYEFGVKWGFIGEVHE